MQRTPGRLIFKIKKKKNWKHECNESSTWFQLQSWRAISLKKMKGKLFWKALFYIQSARQGNKWDTDTYRNTWNTLEEQIGAKEYCDLKQNSVSEYIKILTFFLTRKKEMKIDHKSRNYHYSLAVISVRIFIYLGVLSLPSSEAGSYMGVGLQHPGWE